MAVFYLIFLTTKAAMIISTVYKITPIIRHKLMGLLCFLIGLCSVIGFYKRGFLTFVGFFIIDCASSLILLMTKYSDFGRGCFIFGCFSGIFNVLVLLFMFFLGFSLLQFRGKSSDLGTKNVLMSSSSKMVFSNDDNGDFHGVKNSTFEYGATKMTRVLCKSCGEQMLEENNEVLSSNSGNLQHVEESEVEEIGNEDEVFDVMSMRKMVKVERRKANAAYNELEKERMASSSSVNEAMSMILRLQNEKSALQMQVNQLERGVEEKQLHNQEVIQSLQWIVMKHESEKSALQDQLRLCREKLRGFMKGEDWDQFDCACQTSSASQSSFGPMDHDVMVEGHDLD